MVGDSMSLRARIIVLFATALVLTLAVASFIGERVAARALESSLRERTVDLARTIADELALSPHTDPDRAARQLGAILTRRRGLRSAQLAIRHGHELKTIHVTFGEEGAVLDTTTDRSAAIATTTQVALVDDGGSRSWRVELPLRDGGGRTYGALGSRPASPRPRRSPPASGAPSSWWRAWGRRSWRACSASSWAAG